MPPCYVIDLMYKVSTEIMVPLNSNTREGLWCLEKVENHCFKGNSFPKVLIYSCLLILSDIAFVFALIPSPSKKVSAFRACAYYTVPDRRGIMVARFTSCTFLCYRTSQATYKTDTVFYQIHFSIRFCCTNKLFILF